MIRFIRIPFDCSINAWECNWGVRAEKSDDSKSPQAKQSPYHKAIL